MKHVINILLLGMVMVGLVTMIVSPLWGAAVASVPFLVWGARFLFLIHKSFWAAAVFWGGVGYFQWQVAIIAAALFGVVWFIRAARTAYKESAHTRMPQKWRAKNDPADFPNSYLYDYRYHIGSIDDE